MGFIRTKILKGKHYAYLVENSWKRKTSKQKVKGYLGRVHILEKKPEPDFLTFIGTSNLHEYIHTNEQEQIVTDLTLYELYLYGFKKTDSFTWNFNGIILNLENRTISKDNKNVVLKINDGFFCNHTLRNLFSFNQKGRNKEVAFDFARTFVDAGIKIPKEVFIEFFQKINTSDNLDQ